MSKVLYAKYNRSRREQFQISTLILEEDGERRVEKRALTDSAKDHISALPEYAAAIDRDYANITALPVQIGDDAVVARFPFVEGRSLDEILCEYLERSIAEQDADIILSELKRTLQDIFLQKESKVFTSSAEYEKLFCNGELFEDLPAVETANIDMIAENIFLWQGKMHCLDYEWTFLFSVPRIFLEFRFLYYFYVKYRKQFVELSLDQIAFFEQLDITENMYHSLFDMEEQFQTYVFGENRSERYIDRYKKEVIDPIKALHEQTGKNEELCETIQNLKDEIDGYQYELEKRGQLIVDKDRHIRNLETIIEQYKQMNLNLQKSASRWERLMRFFPLRCLRWAYRKAKNGYRRIKKYREMRGLIVPEADQPRVSIVIPVYNQFEYTFECIRSIVETVSEIPYEIIVGDDMSKDATRKIERLIPGVVVNQNKTDHGFLVNCNRAAQKARGEYLVFLNNDTRVHEEWLSSMLDLMESDAGIGLVGSKLIYPDGTLQEAGGIIWSDGNGWNYGRNQAAEQPEYNYVKEADYISGASIMIRKGLWEEIGGFDERYKPAYNEDSDLAFEVRKRGYKVMYQPKSVVTHYEGVSNGTNTEEGLKKYQVENRSKFQEKWAIELQKQYASPVELFPARDRKMERKTVLFIDHYVPMADQDAGSRTTFFYLKLFLNMGYMVKFIGDNFYPHQPYTAILEQMGIEVLWGAYYAENWKQWLKENGSHIDLVFANRPHITIKYIDALREYTKAKILYYGHDLHHVREMREYEISKDPELIKSAKRWKVLEFDLMSKVDVISYPSQAEIDYIIREHPEYRKKAMAIPMFVYKEPHQFKIIPSQERKDLLFVGGFAHKPNVDAVLWFVKEVFPIILGKYPEIVFHVVGAKPTDEIKELASDNIMIHGHVSDDELINFYHHTRMAVVPLRYGAGMKGKVVEGLYYQIPMVTTPVGAEGMSEAENYMVVKEQADEMAKEIIQMYEDFERLDQMAEKTKEYIDKYFSERVAEKIIEEML